MNETNEKVNIMMNDNANEKSNKGGDNMTMLMCHVCLNESITLTPKKDFVDVNGQTMQMVDDRKRQPNYPLISLCGECVIDYKSMMPFFANWATKPIQYIY